MTNSINPFSEYGRTVSSGNFIGRRQIIKSIENRVTNAGEPNNLAIIGLPRIGKSSVAEHAVLRLQDELLQQKKVVLWINVGTFEDANSLFRQLVFITFRFFERQQMGYLDLEKICKDVMDEQLSWTVLKNETERFFEKVNRLGYRVIFILDEFDSIRMIFNESFSAFQQLRELAYRGSFRVTFITTSRRSIRDIEVQTRANSVLDLIFKKEYLSVFDAAEMEEYYKKLLLAGIVLNEQERKVAEYYCGGHPYLLAVLGFEIVELAKESGAVDMNAACKKVQLGFVNYYEQLINMLREDNTYSKLMQILFGPLINVLPPDVDELLRYGIIKKSGPGYTAFSEHFHAYLFLQDKTGKDKDATSDIFSRAENGFRFLVNEFLVNYAGPGWQFFSEEDEAGAALPEGVPKLIVKLKQNRTLQLQLFGNIATFNLIDFADIDDLASIIASGWTGYFDTIFKNTEFPQLNMVLENMSSISDLRRPAAQQNFEISGYKLSSAVTICEQFINIFSKFSH